MLANIIAGLFVIAVIGIAVFILWKNKKNGDSCFGCPSKDNCKGSCNDNKKEKYK